jgi:fructokinase
MIDVVAFGEVLWDIIDGIPHIGGASLNFAAHVKLCGLSSGVISAVGDDKLGRDTLAQMRRLNVDASNVFIDPRHPTGTVEVSLENGIPSYLIKKDVAWDFIEFPAGHPLPTPPRAFYFGTLAQRSPVSRATLSRLLTAYKGAEIFFDVNLRQSFWDAGKILSGLRNATLLKINEEESARLAPIAAGKPMERNAFAHFLLQKYPNLKAVITTLGPEGCLVCEPGGKELTSPATDDPVLDTVGAGDAFSAAFLTAWLNGASAELAARAGNIRGGWVASMPGAIPDGEPKRR